MLSEYAAERKAEMLMFAHDTLRHTRYTFFSFFCFSDMYECFYVFFIFLGRERGRNPMAARSHASIHDVRSMFACYLIFCLCFAFGPTY